MKRVWTDEQRKRQSKNLKERYRRNPNLHPNRILAAINKLTYPERLAFEFFTKNNINFKCGYRVEEFGYYPDFLLDNKLIVEIDGERWHSSEEQKQSDKIRDERLKSVGYKIIRIPARNVLTNLNNIFSNTKIEDINVEEVKNKIIIVKTEKKKYYCCDCGVEVCRGSKRCSKCSQIYLYDMENSPKKRKFNADKELLEKLVSSKPMTEIGKQFGVSDNAVRKRCKKLGVVIPKNGNGPWILTMRNETIKQLYNNGKSLEEISKIVGVSVEELNRRKRDLLGVKKFEPNLRLDKNEVIRLYESGLTDREISKILHCGKTTVYYIIQQYKSQWG